MSETGSYWFPCPDAKSALARLTQGSTQRHGKTSRFQLVCSFFYGSKWIASPWNKELRKEEGRGKDEPKQGNAYQGKMREKSGALKRTKEVIREEAGGSLWCINSFECVGVFIRRSFLHFDLMGDADRNFQSGFICLFFKKKMKKKAKADSSTLSSISGDE